MLLDTKNTLFVCIDIQERLLGLMAHKDEVIKMQICFCKWLKF